MPAKTEAFSAALTRQLERFVYDPLGHVMFSYPWDSDPTIQAVELQEPWASKYGCKYGPDRWACEFLEEVGLEADKRSFDLSKAVEPLRFSTVSGHGIGKSVLVAWLIKWIMDTRPMSQGTVTATTIDQLKGKTWAELAKWHNMSATRNRFEYTAGRGAMRLRHRNFPERWKCEARTSKEENSESFAGQHAATGTSFYIFDEASGIPDKIFEVREGGLTDGEPMIFDFGNGTKNSGAFFENTEGKRSHRYITRHIDSREVSITNKEFFQQMVDDYGEDSDIVRVRIKGMFPRADSVQFIPSEWVEGAMKRPTPDHIRGAKYPAVLGVDVARFGDDHSAICTRLGDDFRSLPPVKFLGLSTDQLVDRVVDRIKYLRGLGTSVAAVFVDEGGVGGGVVDMLYRLGYPVIGVQFGGSPTDGRKYRYKVDEIWGRMKDALKERLVLPEDGSATGKLGQELRDELTSRQFSFTDSDQIRLETKAMMKKRGLMSPDIADAVALTFAHEVDFEALGGANKLAPVEVVHDYDPMEIA